MLEKTSVRGSLYAALCSSILWTAPTLAVPLTLSNDFLFRDHRDQTARGGTIRDTLQVDIDVTNANTGDFVPGATVTAQNLTTGQVSPMVDCNSPGDTLFDCYLLLADIPTASPEDVLGAQWLISAQDGADTASLTVGPYDPLPLGPGTDALPFAVDVQLTQVDATPVVIWDPPIPVTDLVNLNDGNVSRWRVRFNRADGVEAFDTQRNGQPFGLNNLPLTTTSLELPSAFALMPGDYFVQVMLEGTQPFNRSRIQVPFTVPASVAEPLTLGMLGTGLLLLATTRRRKKLPDA